MPGRYLIIDMQADPPAIVSTDDVLPEALRLRLDSIDANLEILKMSMSAEQQQIENLADAITSVAAHVSSATSTLQQWIEDHADHPDLSHLQAAVDSLTGADAALSGIVPQAPSDPIQGVPDPGPAPEPPTDTTVPSADAPADQPVDPGYGVDVGGSTDTGMGDTGAAGDEPTVNPL